MHTETRIDKSVPGDCCSSGAERDRTMISGVISLADVVFKPAEPHGLGEIPDDPPFGPRFTRRDAYGRDGFHLARGVAVSSLGFRENGGGQDHVGRLVTFEGRQSIATR